MKQLALVALTALALFGLFTTDISSEDSGTVQVKVQPQVVVSISIPAGDQIVDFGELELSLDNDTRTTEESGVLSVNNLGSTAVNLSIEASNAITTAAGEANWNLSCVDQGAATQFRGVVAQNQFALRYVDNPDDSWDVAEALCLGEGKSLAIGVGPTNGQAQFMLQMNMPTGTDGYSQRTSTVTITATAQ